MSASVARVLSLVARAGRQRRAAALGLALALPGLAAAQDEGVHNSALYSFKVVTVVDGLVNPWGLAWLPNGDMLVTERAGCTPLVRGGKLLPDAVPGVPRCARRARRSARRGRPSALRAEQLVYLSFAKPNTDGTQATTRSCAGGFKNDRLDRRARDLRSTSPGRRGPCHFGGRMAFDRKGQLFLSSGDRREAACHGRASEASFRSRPLPTIRARSGA